MSASSTPNVLQRPRTGRVIAGVCAGLAQRFGWSTGLVRLLFVLSLLLPGPQLIVYIVMWILIPNAPLAQQVQAPSAPPSA
ncbi:MAG TPA: PspC domain-containing protein [Rhodoglobus sp.]|nr:PspC domain-containing protein [Rhodoglobus sp.]